MPFLRIAILLLLLFTSSVMAANAMPSALEKQVGNLVQLLQQPGLVEEEETERQWTQIASHWVATFRMSYVGGSGFEDYLALFSGPDQREPLAPYILEGMVRLPDRHYMEMRKLRVSIKSGILALTLHDVSGEPPGNGKPSVWRYSIERPNGWGLRLLAN